MRHTFVKTLVGLAEQDPTILLMTGDLGYSVLEPFQQKFPDRFINVGVAEQNMLGMATGLAEAGFKPYCYSIATFATLRPFEFIRNGAVLHRLPVRIVGVGGGFEYGPAGVTHHALEDIGVLRTQPGLCIIAPTDSQEAADALDVTVNMRKPIYFRLSKNEIDPLPGFERFQRERVRVLRKGTGTLLIALGPLAKTALEAAEAIGQDCGVATIPCLNPPPVEDLAKLLKDCKIVVTVENHYQNGGLGSLVAEVMAERGEGGKLVRVAVKDPVVGPYGDESSMNAAHSLHVMGIRNTIEAAKT